MTAAPSRLDSADVVAALVAAVPMALVDGSDKILEANAPFAELAGKPQADLVGAEVTQVLKGAAREQSGVSGEATYRFHIAGRDRWFRAKRVAAGQATVVSLIDVGVEWRALKVLTTNRNVRDRLLDDSEIGVWSFDPESETFRFGSGLSLGHAEAAGPVPVQVLKSVQHPEDVEKDQTIRDRISTEGGSAEGEMRYRDGKGDWKTLRVFYRAGRKLASGKYELFGLSQNVSELTEARDLAAVMSQRMELAMSAANAGVYEIDLRSGDRWSSDRFNELAGPDALARQTVHPFGLYADAEQMRVRESWARCLESREIEQIDTRLHRLDGSDFWVRIFTRVERDAKGNGIRAVGLMLDINQQKRQELALIEAKREAEAAAVAKSNFLASMSHEIRTPLNGILGMTQVLAADDDLNAPQREKVDVIAESGRTLMALVNDVLDISKIEAGKLEIARAEGELETTCDRVRQLFQATAAERGVAMVLEVSDRLPPRMMYDGVRVRQVVSNLVSNAIKFTERGRVTLRLGAEARPDGDWQVKIAVSDTGIGMDQATIARLFGAFTQADASITRRFGGTGLGLAISRRLARLMGGDVTVESQLGAGSTFTFSFIAGASEGAAEQPEPAAPAAASTADTSVYGARVLLVDDNPVNRKVVRLFLAPLDCRFVEATNGKEALEHLADEAFDIVLLDVHMPVMDGKEAIRLIRAANQIWRDVPVIALTADAMSGDREKYLAMGMNDYVAKPIDSRELAGKMVALLRGRQLVAGRDEAA